MWFLLIMVDTNAGWVVDRAPPTGMEQLRRITQQMNAIHSQADKDAFLWSRLAHLGDDVSADEDVAADGNQMEDDPEVRPHLFQGDIALDLQMYQMWRVGLNWDMFPERKWLNQTVPYAISPLYEPEDQVKR